MEGRIIGQIVEGELKGCEIYGSYLIEFKPSPKVEIAQNVRGTLEGVISCFCQ
jgi:hypothetical protein